MWDERYAAPGWTYGVKPNDFLAGVADRLPVGETLCLAEGQGRNAVFLAERGHRVTAMDQSAVGLARAAELAASRNVALATVQGDLANFDLGEARWDAIVAIWAHTPSAIRRPLHRAIVRALRPGGAFVLEAYRPDQIALATGGPKSDDFLPTLAELREDLTGLELVHGVEIERDIHEGELHNGRSAVVQVLAIRR